MYLPRVSYISFYWSFHVHFYDLLICLCLYGELEEKFQLVHAFATVDDISECIVCLCIICLHKINHALLILGQLFLLLVLVKKFQIQFFTFTCLNFCLVNLDSCLIYTLYFQFLLCLILLNKNIDIRKTQKKVQTEQKFLV